jgi:hypothetical protein
MLAKGIAIFDEISDYIPPDTWPRSATYSTARSHGGPGGKGIIDYGDNGADVGRKDAVAAAAPKSARLTH